MNYAMDNQIQLQTPRWYCAIRANSSCPDVTRKEYLVIHSVLSFTTHLGYLPFAQVQSLRPISVPNTEDLVQRSLFRRCSPDVPHHLQHSANRTMIQISWIRNLLQAANG
uniref:Uncharacterized protein n=1 Tax=Setaria italica TaxID=4555 RepID=K3ZAZ1_SETIT